MLHDQESAGHGRRPGDPRGIDLEVDAGEVHAIMGPNGSGKSTLAYVLAGRDGYEVTAGEVRYEGQDLLALAPEERARAACSWPSSIRSRSPASATCYFLRDRAQRGAQAPRRDRTRRHRLPEAGARARPSWSDERRAAQARPSTTASRAARRSATRSCRWRCWSRRLAILDETDSGLDIDALQDRRRRRQRAARARTRAMIVVTHYQRLLDYIVPDRVHVLAERPHRALRRQGAGPGAGEAGYAAVRRPLPRRSPERAPTMQRTIAPSERYAALFERRCAPARLPPRRAARDWRGGELRALRGAGLPAAQGRGLEVHFSPTARADDYALATAAPAGARSTLARLTALARAATALSPGVRQRPARAPSCRTPARPARPASVAEPGRWLSTRRRRSSPSARPGAGFESAPSARSTPPSWPTAACSGSADGAALEPARSSSCSSASAPDQRGPDQPAQPDRAGAGAPRDRGRDHVALGDGRPTDQLGDRGRASAEGAPPRPLQGAGEARGQPDPHRPATRTAGGRRASRRSRS